MQMSFFRFCLLVHTSLLFLLLNTCRRLFCSRKWLLLSAMIIYTQNRIRLKGRAKKLRHAAFLFFNADGVIAFVRTWHEYVGSAVMPFAFFYSRKLVIAIELIFYTQNLMIVKREWRKIVAPRVFYSSPLLFFIGIYTCLVSSFLTSFMKTL
jgi:hypothetical protein